MKTGVNRARLSLRVEKVVDDFEEIGRFEIKSVSQQTSWSFARSSFTSP
jgi:hypothetical protein